MLMDVNFLAIGADDAIIKRVQSIPKSCDEMRQDARSDAGIGGHLSLQCICICWIPEIDNDLSHTLASLEFVCEPVEPTDL